MRLHEDQREIVRIEKWDAGAQISIETTGGAEFFVLEGSFKESGETVKQRSWLRIPINADFSAVAGPDGALKFG